MVRGFVHWRWRRKRWWWLFVPTCFLSYYQFLYVCAYILHIYWQSGWWWPTNTFIMFFEKKKFSSSWTTSYPILVGLFCKFNIQIMHTHIEFNFVYTCLPSVMACPANRYYYLSFIQAGLLFKRIERKKPSLQNSEKKMILVLVFSFHDDCSIWRRRKPKCILNVFYMLKRWYWLLAPAESLWSHS